MILQFGKYNGQKVSELPTTYITHILENFPMNQELIESLIEELDKRIPKIKEYHFGTLDNSF